MPSWPCIRVAARSLRSEGHCQRRRGTLRMTGDQHEHAGGNGCAGGRGGRIGAGVAGRGRAWRRRSGTAGCWRLQGASQGRVVAGVAGAIRAGRGVRHHRRGLWFHCRVPDRRVAAGRCRAGHPLRSRGILWVRRGQDSGCGVPGYGPPGRVAEAGGWDMARDHPATGLMRGRRSAGWVPDPPGLPGWGGVAGPASAWRGMAGVRGRQGRRGCGLVWHGGLSPQGRGLDRPPTAKTPSSTGCGCPPPAPVTAC
jgi:hypothetical protein